MKVGDLVMKKSYGRTWDNGHTPLQVVVQTKTKIDHTLTYIPYIVTDMNPHQWQEAKKFFIVSPA